MSERTALADTRTSASTIVLVLVLTIRAATGSPSGFAITMLVLGLAGGVLAWWEATARYVWRADPQHRVPRPWAAFTAALSVACSCLAGLSLSVTDLPGAIDLILR